MDPLTLIAVGAAALAGIGVASATASRGRSASYRRVTSWADGWVATELLSPEALEVVGSSMGIPLLAARESELLAGFRRFVLVTKRGAPPTFAVLAVYDRVGGSAALAEAWGVGMSKPSRPEQWQHLSELTSYLQRDLGKVVAGMAAEIASPERRYAFLRAVIRRPLLSALVVLDDDFAAAVVSTTALVHPERLRQVESSPEPSPVSLDLGIRPLPRIPRTHSSAPPLPGRRPELPENPTVNLDLDLVPRQPENATAEFAGFRFLRAGEAQGINDEELYSDIPD